MLCTSSIFSVKTDGEPFKIFETLPSVLIHKASMLGSAIIKKQKHWLILAITVVFLLLWHYTDRKSQPAWINWRPDSPPSNEKVVTSSPTSGRTAATTAPSNTTIAVNNPTPTAIASPSNTPYSQTLVIAKLQEEDASWAENIEHELPYLKSAIYTVDNENASLTVPMNKGHEAMVYLTYIIDHYSQLSDITLFMHSHQYTWHNNDFLNSDSALMVKRLKSEHVIKNGYMNLRCHQEPGCPDHIHPTAANNPEDITNIPEAAVIGVSWKQLFPNETVPEVLSQPCCSQFAVSSERIRNVSLDDYVSYREWLLDTVLEDKVSGRVWEYIWQWLFTGQWEYCPEETSCYCEGYGVCFEKDDYADYFKFREEAWALEKEIDKIKESVNNTLDIPEDRISSMQVDVHDLRQKMNEIRSKAI